MSELVCPGEWCKDNGLTAQAFCMMKARNPATFPKPVYQWSTVSIYVRASLDRWYANRQRSGKRKAS